MVPRAVVLRVIAHPCEEIPASWVREAHAWTAGDLDAQAPLKGKVGVTQFPLPAGEAQSFLDRCASSKSNGALVSGDLATRIRGAYSRNYDRLVALKNQYDPTNLFRLNQNIRPTV